MTLGLAEGDVCAFIESAWKLRSVSRVEVNNDVLNIFPTFREYEWEGEGEGLKGLLPCLINAYARRRRTDGSATTCERTLWFLPQHFRVRV